MSEEQLPEETAAMLAALREKISDLEQLPLDEVAPALGDPREP